MGSQHVDTAIADLLMGGVFSVGELALRTGLSRQALQRHLARWIDEGRLRREGAGRGTHYRSAGGRLHRELSLAGLDEAEVWGEVQEWIAASGAATPEAVAITHYVFTELLNNAIDHSGSQRSTVELDRLPSALCLSIEDDGVGAFENLRSRLGLDSHLTALQELSKGKLTTMPERHSGEGIFFSSKAVEHFELEANGLRWTVDNRLPDQAVASSKRDVGTLVRAEIDVQASTALEEIFARYTHDFEFDTTRCVVRLFEYGTRLMSRSEAKRVVARLDGFRHAVLDFRGVGGVGQGFVDEVFRVWARAHPQTELVPEGMNEAVEFMVRRGLPSLGRTD